MSYRDIYNGTSGTLYGGKGYCQAGFRYLYFPLYIHLNFFSDTVVYLFFQAENIHLFYGDLMRSRFGNYHTADICFFKAGCFLLPVWSEFLKLKYQYVFDFHTGDIGDISYFCD